MVTSRLQDGGRPLVSLSSVRKVDETKRGRDLGVYLLQRVAQAFREGAHTQIAAPEACEQMYERLARLHSNYYKHKDPRPTDTSSSGLSLEKYKLILATETLDGFQVNKGLWKRLQEKFVPRRPEEKHKAWAQVLSRPRT